MGRIFGAYSRNTTQATVISHDFPCMVFSWLTRARDIRSSTAARNDPYLGYCQDVPMTIHCLILRYFTEMPCRVYPTSSLSTAKKCHPRERQERSSQTGVPGRAVFRLIGAMQFKGRHAIDASLRC